VAEELAYWGYLLRRPAFGALAIYVLLFGQ